MEKREGGVVVLIRLIRKSRDDVGAQAEDGQPLREPLDPRAVGLGSVPVASHALQDAVRARLQRRVQVRRDVTRRLDQEVGEGVVDFRGLDGGESEPCLRNRCDKALQEAAQGG